MKSNDFLHQTYTFVTYESVFVGLSTIVNVFFILYFFGFLQGKNELVERISFFLKVFIGVFLVVRFNPFYPLSNHPKKLTEFDRKVVFSAGCYMLIIYGIGLYDAVVAKDQAKKMKKKIQNQNQNVMESSETVPLGKV